MVGTDYPAGHLSIGGDHLQVHRRDLLCLSDWQHEGDPGRRTREDPLSRRGRRGKRLRAQVPLAAGQAQSERAGRVRRRVAVARRIEAVGRYHCVDHGRGCPRKDDVTGHCLESLGQRDHANVHQRDVGLSDDDGEWRTGQQSINAPGRGSLEPELAGGQAAQEKVAEFVGGGLSPKFVVKDDDARTGHRRAGVVVHDADHVGRRDAQFEYDVGGDGNRCIFYRQLDVFAAFRWKDLQDVGHANSNTADLELAGDVGARPLFYTPVFVVGNDRSPLDSSTRFAVLHPTADAHLGQEQVLRGPLSAQDLHHHWLRSGIRRFRRRIRPQDVLAGRQVGDGVAAIRGSIRAHPGLALSVVDVNPATFHRRRAIRLVEIA